MEHDFDAIVRTFVAESEENLRALDEGFVALESRPDDAETLATIFRMAHTLKGNAASLGYEALASFAHAVEDILDRLRQRKLTVEGNLITLLLKAVDALRELVADATSGVEEMRPSHRALLERLTTETRTPDAAPPPAAPPAADPHDPNEEAPDHHEGAHDGDAHDAEAAGTAEAAGRQAARAPSDKKKTLRVDIERLNRMLNLAGEIAIERTRMRGMIDLVGGSQKAKLLERHDEADGIFAELQETVMKLRMVPIGPTFRQQSRTVRDAASSLGKQVRLAIEGEDEEMDTALVELIKDPLTHMIRNAVDHGIEPPDTRRARGKDPTGTITLRARHESGNIVIQITDDGRGLPRSKIVERARAMGIEGPDALKDRELYELIFEPGFSTATTVTDLSGRGVGMDVVRRNVQALRGTIAIESHEGAGTTFRIRLPLTVAIIDGFAVTAGPETYVVPLDNVVECLELPPQVRKEALGVIQLRGNAIPFFRLRDVFQLPAQKGARESLVVLSHEDESIGLAVDQLLGVSQVVIKPPGKLIDGRPGLAGSTILGTGKVAFILDVPGLLRMATKSVTEPERGRTS
jgi:two-component system chemotaxis sensor kinase CheA